MCKEGRFTSEIPVNDKYWCVWLALRVHGSFCGSVAGAIQKNVRSFFPSYLHATPLNFFNTSPSAYSWFYYSTSKRRNVPYNIAMCHDCPNSLIVALPSILCKDFERAWASPTLIVYIENRWCLYVGMYVCVSAIRCACCTHAPDDLFHRDVMCTRRGEEYWTIVQTTVECVNCGLYECHLA